MDPRNDKLLSTYLHEFVEKRDELNIDMAYVIRRIRALEVDRNNLGIQICALSGDKEQLQKQIVELKAEVAQTRKAVGMPRKQYERSVVAEQLQFIRAALTRSPGAKLEDLRRPFEQRWPRGVMSKQDFCYSRVYQLVKEGEVIGGARTGYILNNVRDQELGFRTFDG